MKNWFQSLPFKCNLQRYSAEPGPEARGGGMGPTRWTHAVAFKEKTADGKPCATTLTLATDVPPEVAPAAAAAHANSSSGGGGGGGGGISGGGFGGGGGGGRGGEGAPHLSPSLMKSAGRYKLNPVGPIA